MTIDISTPDGSSFSFPDGTTHEVIKGALDKHYGVAKPAPITAENVVRSVGRGIPVVGGLLDKANAATYAALTPAYESLLPSVAKGDTTISHKPSFSERYTENLARENVKDLSYAKDHPVANMAGELAGGIGSAAAAAPTAIGARLLGLNGTTLGGATWRGGLSGAGIGAADAVARGHDPVATGGIGGLIGVGAPVVGRVASTIAAPIVNALRGARDPAGEAARRYGGVLQRDRVAGTAGLTDAEIAAAEHAGLPVLPIDRGGESTFALARSAANTSPEGRRMLTSTLDDRYAGQGPRTVDWFKSGQHYPTDAQRNAALAHVSNNEIGPKYMAAMKDAASTPLWPNAEVRKIPGLESLPSNLPKHHEALLSDLAELTQAPEMQTAIRLANSKLRNYAVRDQIALRESNRLRNSAAEVLFKGQFSRDQVQKMKAANEWQLAGIEKATADPIQRARAPDWVAHMEGQAKSFREEIEKQGNFLAGGHPANAIVTPPRPFMQIVNGQTVMNPVETSSGKSVVNVPTLRYWDYIKRALDEMGTPTSKSFARTIRNNLDEIVPRYAEARASAQPTKFFQGAGDAHEAGQNFFRRGDKFDSVDTQKALTSMSETERKLFKDGYSEAYINFIEKHPNRRNLLNEINKSTTAQKEFETALGPQRARELEARMRVEHIMNDARNEVKGNSTTARQLVELGLAGGASMLEGGSPIPHDPQSALTAALVWGAARGHRAIDSRVSLQVAKLLASNNPQQHKIGMTLLTQNPNMLAALRYSDTALASVAARGAQPALTQ